MIVKMHIVYIDDGWLHAASNTAMWMRSFFHFVSQLAAAHKQETITMGGMTILMIDGLS